MRILRPGVTEGVCSVMGEGRPDSTGEIEGAGDCSGVAEGPGDSCAAAIRTEASQTTKMTMRLHVPRLRRRPNNPQSAVRESNIVTPVDIREKIIARFALAQKFFIHTIRYELIV